MVIKSSHLRVSNMTSQWLAVGQGRKESGDKSPHSKERFEDEG